MGGRGGGGNLGTRVSGASTLSGVLEFHSSL